MKYDVNELYEIIKKACDDYYIIGIRAANEDYIKGDILPKSYHWEDNVKTKQKLGGTSSIYVTSGFDIMESEKEQIVKALELVKRYVGKNVYIIGGDREIDYSNDEQEVVIENAQIIEKIN